MYGSPAIRVRCQGGENSRSSSRARITWSAERLYDPEYQVWLCEGEVCDVVCCRFAEPGGDLGSLVAGQGGVPETRGALRGESLPLEHVPAEALLWICCVRELVAGHPYVDAAAVAVHQPHGQFGPWRSVLIVDRMVVPGAGERSARGLSSSDSSRASRASSQVWSGWRFTK